MVNEKLLSTANKLADIASMITKSYFRNKVDSSMKNTSSLVTAADLNIEKAIREYIKNEYPEHSILGEEYGLNNNKSEYLWVIDPIDGTNSFICGKPTFCTLIALLHNNEPIIGIIDQAITNERWIGQKGKKTTYNDTECSSIESDIIRINCTTPLMFSEKQRKTFNKIQEMADISCYGGDGYAYGLLASGYIEIIMEADLQFYDVAALIPIIEGMDGVITDWSGNNINFSKFDGTIIATQNKEIFNKTQKTLKNL
jgi:inositol-phosphate phosphatase/L-galactose 1-phosphate phosphatase/histidinol-phosphatase